jgi:hypothetical protein
MRYTLKYTVDLHTQIATFEDGTLITVEALDQ